MRLLIILLLLLTSVNTLFAQCDANSGSIVFSNSVLENENVFGSCSTIEVENDAFNNSDDYEQILIITTGLDYFITSFQVIDTLSTTHILDSLPSGDYKLHALNYLTNNAPVLPSLNESLSLLFNDNNDSSCFTLNNSDFDSTAVESGIDFTVLEPITMHWEHICDIEDEGYFTMHFALEGGLPQYNNNYKYTTLGFINYSDNLEYDDEVIVQNICWYESISIIAFDITGCETQISDYTITPCLMFINTEPQANGFSTNGSYFTKCDSLVVNGNYMNYLDSECVDIDITHGFLIVRYWSKKLVRRIEETDFSISLNDFDNATYCIYPYAVDNSYDITFPEIGESIDYLFDLNNEDDFSILTYCLRDFRVSEYSTNENQPEAGILTLNGLEINDFSLVVNCGFTISA